MYSMGHEEQIAADTAEVNAGVNGRSGATAETIGRLSVSFSEKRARLAMMEKETRSGIIDQAMEDGNIVDWMPNIINNVTPTPVASDHIGV